MVVVAHCGCWSAGSAAVSRSGTSGRSVLQVEHFSSIDPSENSRSMPRQPPQQGHQGRQKVAHASDVTRGVQSLQRATSERLGGGWQDSHRQPAWPCGSHQREQPHRQGASGSAAGAMGSACASASGAEEIFISKRLLIESNKFIFPTLSGCPVRPVKTLFCLYCAFTPFYIFLVSFLLFLPPFK